MIRRVRVEASDNQSAEGDLSAAAQTRDIRGKGDSDISVSASVECFTSDDMA